MNKKLLNSENDFKNWLRQVLEPYPNLHCPESYPCIIVYIEIDDGENENYYRWEFVYKEDWLK